LDVVLGWPLTELHRVEQGRHQHQLVDPEAGLLDPHPQLAHREAIGQAVVRRLVHPVGSLGLGPPHHVVRDPEPQAAAEVDLAPLVHPGQDVDAAFDQRRDPEVRGEGAVPQDDVASVEAVPQGAEQGRLAGPLALGRPESQVTDHTGRERDDGDEPRQGEPQPGLLDRQLGKGALVGRGIGHRDGGAVDQQDAPPLPVPGGRGPVLRRPADATDEPG
jgi:hypothetical protein